MLGKILAVRIQVSILALIIVPQLGKNINPKLITWNFHFCIFSHLVPERVVKGHGLDADAVGVELLEHHLLRVVDLGGVAVCLSPDLLSILIEEVSFCSALRLHHLREQPGSAFLVCISLRRFSVPNSTMVT